MKFKGHLALAVLLLLAGSGSCGSGGLIDSFSSWLKDRCSKSEVPKNFDRLEISLRHYLFGQPLVTAILIGALESHLNETNPKKALAISFHGPTGVGKNYVAKLVADATFREGTKSKYVKIFVKEKDFPHAHKIEDYKEKVVKTIESMVKACETSLFIFDESDRMPNGLLDVLKPYLDFHESLDGVDYRKSVFMFLNNLGASEISQMTLDLNLKNIERERFELKPFQEMLHRLSYFSGDKKGMASSTVIEKYLIDFFVPFLPLERQHVKQCAKVELRRLGAKNGEELEQDVDAIADQMDYEPKTFKKYSASGCKRVAKLANAYFSERRLNFNQLNTEF